MSRPPLPLLPPPSQPAPSILQRMHIFEQVELRVGGAGSGPGALGGAARAKAGIFSDAMIPESELMERFNQRNQPVGGLVGMGRPRPTGGSPHVDSKGLILPRKLPNPCLDSSEKKNLQRELKFNQKTGKNPLNQKTELQRVLQKHNEIRAKNEVEQQRQQNKTPFELVIEERARKLEPRVRPEERSNGPEPEFLQVHAKMRAKMEPK